MIDLLIFIIAVAMSLACLFLGFIFDLFKGPSPPVKLPEKHAKNPPSADNDGQKILYVLDSRLNKLKTKLEQPIYGKSFDEIVQESQKKHEDRTKDYHRYLKSAVWKHKRWRKLESTNFICRDCGRRATQVHHIHYPNVFGEEELVDLRSVCRKCHGKYHPDNINPSMDLFT